MTMVMGANREAHLEAAGLGAHILTGRGRPTSLNTAYFTLMMALILTLAGSNTASSGWPRPISGIEFA